jgi:hypothetical protein
VNSKKDKGIIECKNNVKRLNFWEQEEYKEK